VTNDRDRTAGLEAAAVSLLAGKRAVVTGGANGIGAGIVRVLAAAGAAPGVVLDLPATLGRRPLPEGWVGIPVDLRSDESTAAAFEEVRGTLGTIDVLAAAAGIVPLWTGIGELEVAEWDDIFRVNARGVMRSMQGVLSALADDGAIVVIASQNAWRGNANLASYVASKHAVLGLVRSAALEFGPRGIRINAVAPGSVATDAYMARLKHREDEGGPPVAEALDRDGKTTALGRLATIEEVAKAVLFLASDLSSGVTGHLLPVGPGGV
jgi:NAD(P)-dependent dehydrogenase (short-subunit alcohol dehydrogenase family)